MSDIVFLWSELLHVKSRYCPHFLSNHDYTMISIMFFLGTGKLCAAGQPGYSPLRNSVDV